MLSFKDLRELLVLSYDSKLISDEEFGILYRFFVRHLYPPFVLDNIGEAECKAEFRVEKRDLPRDAMEGVCMLLSRYSDLIPRFGGKPVSVISLITCAIIVLWPAFNSVSVFLLLYTMQYCTFTRHR